ncbi:hypothetical protein K474DRAFT_1017183 [Panus rudis PR-1116 ss-1]|nr:hypothetical protein K474DRAFT_1017183 [Panus rudis PR-1116 ss-1]
MSFGELIDLSKYMGIPQDKVAQLDLPDLVAINSSPTISSTDSQIIAVDEIRVSGKPVGKTSTSIPGGPTGKLAAQVQTANPYIVLDKSYVDAIYGSIPGASYSDQDRVYHLPCTTELTISIVISGTEYLFNPLSVVALTDVKDTCVGKFKASDPASKDPFDIALGLPFFESVYSIFGYQRDSSNNLGTPYWKFLSIIRAPDAHSLFVQRRGGSSANQSQGANQLGAAVAVGGAAQSGNNHNQQQSRPTTTRYTTVTFTHTPTTTVWFGSPTASTTSKAAHPAQNDAVSGNLSDNDSENHESAGYILGQVCDDHLSE